MRETRLEKRGPVSLKEKAEYGLAFGVIALMLFVVGFPVFLLLFFGVLAFFTWRVLTAETRNETRKIFEFYLSANEILREDDRRWYGFELQEAIARGETIIRSMTTPPPLVHFAVGALYQKIGDQTSAAGHLVHALEDPAADELSVVYPSKELREYVRFLRRIERTPAKSPLTSSAVRSLERARRNRGMQMLDLSRAQAPNGENTLLKGITEPTADEPLADQPRESVTAAGDPPAAEEKGITYRFADFARTKRSKKNPGEIEHPDRQTISEVLHDIYDNNVQ